MNNRIQEFIAELLSSRVVLDEYGAQFPLHSGIHQIEGECLAKLVSSHRCRRTIEIGCAYGVSSLYICSGIAQFEDAHHTIVDPYQREWKNIGILNLQRTGFKSFTLVEELSELALPDMLSNGKKFDFAFIDGWHTFDHTLVDFFYLNRMLDVGGIVAFHDVDMPSVKKLMRYISNYPSYRLIETVQALKYPISAKQKIFNAFAKRPLENLSKLLPNKNVHQLFSDSIVRPAEKVGLEATLVAFQKTDIDRRDWKWFMEF